MSIIDFYLVSDTHGKEIISVLRESHEEGKNSNIYWNCSIKNLHVSINLQYELKEFLYMNDKKAHSVGINQVLNIIL